jgi:hypothetical protein
LKVEGRKVKLILELHVWPIIQGAPAAKAMALFISPKPQLPESLPAQMSAAGAVASTKPLKSKL